MIVLTSLFKFNYLEVFTIFFFSLKFVIIFVFGKLKISIKCNYHYIGNLIKSLNKFQKHF